MFLGDNIMDVYTLCLGELGTNCYIVSSENKNAVIIDPADEAEKIFEFVQNKGLSPKKILLTHGHYDHILAAQDVRAKYGIPVYVHLNDKLKLSSRTENLHAVFLAQKPFKEVKEPVTFYDEEIIEQDELKFEAIHTPGHTPGSVCYICGEAVFTGDTLFKDSIGRTDFPGGSYDDILSSLERLKELEGNRKIYPGHGEATTLEREKHCNIFMKDFDDIF